MTKVKKCNGGMSAGGGPRAVVCLGKVASYFKPRRRRCRNKACKFRCLKVVEVAGGFTAARGKSVTCFLLLPQELSSLIVRKNVST